MPPSSDQDSINLNEAAQPTKTSLRTSGGVQIPTRNGRKNGTAKDSSGGPILAAVTKNASKLSNAKASSAFSNKAQPADMKPTNSSPKGNPITSPYLDALPSATDRSSSQNTNEWARNVPAFSGSPGNLIHLGESPPTVPSSYEDRLVGFGWTTRDQRGIPNGYLPSASPPTNKRRPLSYQLDGSQIPSFDDHRSQISSYAPRRSSMYSQQPRYTQHPPLPHQAQAHFYGAPDANMGLTPQAPGIIPGDSGYYCGFDSLSMASQDPSRTAENVVLTGYEGGLHVYGVSKRGLRKAMSIDALRGGVFHARILPWTLHCSNLHHFPLIALVVHGPACGSSDTSSVVGSELQDSPPTTQNCSARGSPGPAGLRTNDLEPVEYYQTTVEVYSLSTKQHVATLLSLPKTNPNISTTNHMLRAPRARGSLTLHADSGNLVVASGSTGETWIFRHGGVDAGSWNKFRCIGKVWTAVQHGVTSQSPGLQGSLDLDWNPNDPTPVQKPYKASILSMNGRWLAFCPPTPSSRVSLHATVPGLLSATRIPGLSTQTPPQLPNVNCAVETPGDESMVGRLMQTGTQKFIEAGNYLAQQGFQAWNNYRNKPAPNQPTNGAPVYQTHAPMIQQFPPTHGIPAPAPLVTKDPGLVSILDLDALARTSSNGSPHALATFRVPHGCSFLSFAPSGLALFTASSKGDVQNVWDLMRIQYTKSSFLKGNAPGQIPQSPCVRQIAQFSRMTVARIVDVVWTSPHGERAAMVTEPGTVHILDLPASAFTWPAPRRRVVPSKPIERTSEPAGVATIATGVATSAVSSLWTVAKPLVGRRRRSSVGISARTVTAQAGHGTQALAAGISRSVGAATGKMTGMRKSSTTKLHLPRSAVVPSRGCVLLVNGKKNDQVIVVGEGIVRLYTIKNRRADRPVDQQKALRGANYVEFTLPKLPAIRFSLEHVSDFQPADLELAEKNIEQSRWKDRKPPMSMDRSNRTESSIPQAEIESNAPYQPFHTDRRIGLYVYSSEESIPTSPSVSVLLSPPRVSDNKGIHSNVIWAFGGPIKSMKLEVGPAHNPVDDFDVPASNRALPKSSIERVMRVTDSTENIEQIVITTRRRKASSRPGEGAGNGDEEGFFEDDCEVLDFASQRV